jgi:hypothetical protein
MKKVKAQSNIIATILIILISIIAIIIVYNVVLALIKNSAAQIGLGKLRTQLDIRDVNLWVTGGASIQVKRNSLLGGLDSLKIVFYEENGASHTIVIDDITRLPKILETRTIALSINEIPINNSQIDRISIYPVADGQIGLEFKEPESSIERDVFGKRILDTIPETISWWKFDDGSKDSVGSNHGSLEGGSAITEEGYLFLDNDGDYVNMGYPQSLDIKGHNWTISAWADPASLDSIQYVVAKSDFSGDTDGRYALFLFANRFAAMIDDGDEKSAFGTVEITLGEWVYLTAVYKRGAELMTYVNGKFDASIPISDNAYEPIGHPFQIGNIPNSQTYFDGMIDDVMVYQKALSEDQIKAIYNNQRKV